MNVNDQSLRCDVRIIRNQMRARKYDNSATTITKLASQFRNGRRNHFTLKVIYIREIKEKESISRFKQHAVICMSRWMKLQFSDIFPKDIQL